MPLQATSGAASYDAFGGGVAAVPQYIEDVFSTWLYTGTGATQTITNGIDLAGKGGLVWTKSRGGGASNDHILKDTVRGGANWLYSNNTFEQQTGDTGFSFGSTGFTLSSSSLQNQSTINHASWTFREQPKFFDVVTWTGDDASNRQIPHNLGSVPGCFIIKRTDTSGFGWVVYHQSLGNTQSLSLQSTAAANTTSIFNNTSPTATNFTVNAFDAANRAGGTYVAYLFAHDAGGFGLTGTDNVISCGSYTGTGTSGNFVTLGYEPQWVLIKRASVAGNDWILFDNMRGMPVGTADSFLRPNTTAAEDSLTDYLSPTATGFELVGGSSNTNTSGNTYIYIAIRRGPMKVPTTGTSVFDADTLIPAANLTGTKVTNPFAMDFLLTAQRDRSGLASTFAADRLRGGSQTLFTNATSAETNLGSTYNYKLDFNDGFVDNVAYPNGTVTTPMIYWSFRRAPGFFDEVCYTGTGATQTISHNLAAIPELIILRARSLTSDWLVSHSYNISAYGSLQQNIAFAVYPAYPWNRTSTTFQAINDTGASIVGATYVAYLFATCPGVSKVGSYTGTGTTQTINCGFTGGARFVLIKKTSGTGSWYVWDSSRGIVAGNDPYLLLNSTAAEVTNTDYVDTASVGFEISSTAPSEINENGGSFIFLAIA